VEAIQESRRIVQFSIAEQFEIESDELVAWDLESDVPMASQDEIEAELALGHPAWGSLMRVAE